jgi:hypothetical protein
VLAAQGRLGLSPQFGVGRVASARICTGLGIEEMTLLLTGRLLLSSLDPWGWAHGFLCQWRFHHRAVDALPAPGDALHLVVLAKSSFPRSFEEACSLPFEEPLVSGACTADARLGQRLPLAAVRST